jgi:WD40 repeat protein
VFLLAFRDGTVAAYDATGLFHDREDDAAYPQAVGGEIYTFRHLHNVISQVQQSSFSASSTSSSPLGQGVTGIEFITGHRSRAVTCGADGKCRVIDSEKKAIIRSWHVRAPATALSLMSSKSAKSPLAAVGRLDGKISIYELSGTLLHEIVVGESPQKVCSYQALPIW